MAPKSSKKCKNRRFAAHIRIKKYHLGKMTNSPLSTNVPVVLYIGIILLRLYDNLFFSSRKESKELMLKETASPLNGFFYFDFLGERGFNGNIYRCPPPQDQLKKIKFFIYTLLHRHTINRILFRRPHSFDPLEPRRNLVYRLCSVFLFFIQSYPHTFCPIVRISHHWLALMRHRQFLVFYTIGK